MFDKFNGQAIWNSCAGTELFAICSAVGSVLYSKTPAVKL